MIFVRDCLSSVKPLQAVGMKDIGGEKGCIGQLILQYSLDRYGASFHKDKDESVNYKSHV